jgi:hypothetical protein
MNRQFYEFWGNFFTQMAQGQKQLDELTTWMKEGFGGTKELNELFRRCYGLSPPKADDNQASQIWQKAIKDFQQSSAQLAKQWGWVSQTEHQAVLDRCALLEKQVQEQQVTIKELRNLLEEKGLAHTELFQHLNKAIKEQTNQFNVLMESIHEAFKEK